MLCSLKVKAISVCDQQRATVIPNSERAFVTMHSIEITPTLHLYAPSGAWALYTHNTQFEELAMSVEHFILVVFYIKCVFSLGQSGCMGCKGLWPTIQSFYSDRMRGFLLTFISSLMFPGLLFLYVMSP